MITTDPERRRERLREVVVALEKDTAPGDAELLGAFAEVVLAETPDRVVFGRDASVLAARTADQFRFFAREIPPPPQLYKGLPGIHVSVRNTEEPSGGLTAGGRQLRREMTTVQTHTLDAPFIFESLKNYLRKSELRVYSAIHPILSVRRQWERIVTIDGARGEGTKELFCDFRIERAESWDALRDLEHEIYSVLKSLSTAVDDFPGMQRGVRELAGRLRSRHGKQEEVESARAFLEWLNAGNYIFMGSARYRFDPDGVPHREADSAAGVLTDEGVVPVVFPGVIDEVEGHMSPGPDDDRIVDIDFCNNAEAIYHLEPIDDIVVREWGEDGRLKVAVLLLGRFAKGAFTQKAGEIPLIREKQRWLEEHSDATPNSFFHRETREIFNRFPARELFYADAPSLREIVDRIVYMSGDVDVAVSCREGAGYIALYVAFSRLRYSYKTEEQLREAFEAAFGEISFSTSEDLGSWSLLLFYFNSAALEHAVEESAVRLLVESLLKTWEDRVGEALEDALGEREGRRLYRRYVTTETRSGLYRESTAPEEVAADVQCFERLKGRIEIHVQPRTTESALLKVFSPRPLVLTDSLRILQNLGLDVTDDLRISISLPDGQRCSLNRFEVEGDPARIARLIEDTDNFREVLRALDEGRASDGSLNRFVLTAGLTWRDIEALRTLRNHLLQIRAHYTTETVNGVLLRNPDVAVALFRAFEARFDPGLGEAREAAVETAEAAFQEALERVSGLADDEVLRGFHNLIRAAVRTSFYQRPERPTVALKVDSRLVEGMPSPRPMYEIYVHSRLLEGIHLRGGKVARGGLRWSDRHDDFRTEILSLMKTQMVKNSIIVPVGSKGGFVLKGELPPRPALDAWLVDRYREFVSALLDVTDNRVGGRVLHPPDVVRHDDDDPYLVVAADKGTAHLSDVANSVSNQYGLWLGDAFASGGSAGYDHKKVGITARGAWECVRHSFRILGVDVRSEPFTMVGIGDMSGDVFGNGALRSRTARLVGAFNHLHVFLDPDPDPEASYRERERLFRLPRSTWRDYDPSGISAGGGVFDRSAKSIPLSPQVRGLLDIDAESASGEEVIRRLLTARVDLLYNGGIGTYVKGSREQHADVGDRTNDRVRVDADGVRARVVGEGGNLGFTQKARLEYWAGGGLINTDAIDNSGGVGISDREVNLKILMEDLIAKGEVASREERNEILAEMTEEVAELVLRDNRDQARALTLDGLRSAERYEEFVALIDDMEGAGILNRTDDAIPSRDELLMASTRERGLPRPLLALLLGHTKIWAYDLAVQAGVLDGERGRSWLEGYCPERIRERWGDHLAAHPLRLEIATTAAVNHIVNNAGAAYLARVTAASGQGLGAVVSAHLEVDRDSGAEAVRREILGSEAGATEEHRLLVELEAVVEGLVLEKLHDGGPVGGREAVERLRARLKPTG